MVFFLYQGGRESSNVDSFRVLAGFWLIGAMIFVNLYSGTVISFLTLQAREPPIRSYEDLAKSEHVKLILLNATALSRQILVNLLKYSGLYRIILNNLTHFYYIGIASRSFQRTWRWHSTKSWPYPRESYGNNEEIEPRNLCIFNCIISRF